MKNNDEIKSVEVFSGQFWEVELVKSLLENAEINAYLVDEFQGTMAPWVASPGGAGSIKVTVSSADYENARQVVDDYYKNKTNPDDSFTLDEDQS